MTDLSNSIEVNNIVDLIASMELSKGTRSDSLTGICESYNFNAANEIIKLLGGSLIIEPPKEPNPIEYQHSHNITLYMLALLVRSNSEKIS